MKIKVGDRICDNDGDWGTVLELNRERSGYTHEIWAKWDRHVKPLGTTIKHIVKVIPKEVVDSPLYRAMKEEK
jgi:hypothetical protein